MRIFPSLVAARAINQHQVWLVFEDGTEGMKDFAEFLPFAPFHFLREPAFFQQVKVSKDGRVLYWNEDLDFCADALFLELKGLSLDQWKNKQEFHAAH